MLESKVNIHRIKEVLKNISGKFTFPLAELRKERGLRDQHFDAPDALPDADDNSDTEDRPKDEEPTNANAADADANVRSAKADADPADELSAKAEVPLGIDERGLGKETLPGRDVAYDKHGNVVSGSGGVRVRKGSTRPLGIPPEQWK